MITVYKSDNVTQILKQTGRKIYNGNSIYITERTEPKTIILESWTTFEQVEKLGVRLNMPLNLKLSDHKTFYITKNGLY